MNAPNHLCLLAIAGLGACATAPLPTTDDPVKAERAPAEKPPTKSSHTAVRDLETIHIDGIPDDTITVEVIAKQLELTLLSFTSERRMLTTRLRAANKPRTTKRGRRRRRKDRQWPVAMQTLWHKLLLEFEEGLSIAADEVMPRRILIQARVATEAERELTERAFGPCPKHLADRITGVHRTVAILRRRAAAGSGLVARRNLSDLPAISWPVAPVIFTSFFGYRRDPKTARVKFHTGVDLGGSRGDLVSSAAVGRVVHAGYTGGYGNMVVVQHTGGYQTVYAHLSRIFVPLGVEVDGGSPIGQVGSSGRSTGPHLHFEVRRGGVPTDPIKAVRRGIASAGTRSRSAAAARSSFAKE